MRRLSFFTYGLIILLLVSEMVRNLKDRWIFGILCGFLILLGSGMYAHADETSAVPQISVGVDTIWVVIAASLVFFMQAGFGMVEAGFVRVKNTCNILTKNFLDYCMACIAFLMFGYAMMFGQGNGFIGISGWFLFDAHSPTSIPLSAFLLFQTAFCGAAASIVAGGMAERMKFPSYLISSFIISAIVYPIVGHWVWGGGWLGKMGFSDFAGSTVVHTVGGITALVNYPRINAEASCFSRSAVQRKNRNEGLFSDTEELPSPQASIRAIPALLRNVLVSLGRRRNVS